MSLMKSRFWNKNNLRSLPILPILLTATGNIITVCGATELRIGVVSRIHPEVLVADIVNDFILRLKIMAEYGFVVDVRNKVLKTTNEKILLTLPCEFDLNR